MACPSKVKRVDPSKVKSRVGPTIDNSRDGGCDNFRIDLAGQGAIKWEIWLAPCESNIPGGKWRNRFWRDGSIQLQV